jgi:Kef-type K+ transport system membrane component KefB
MTILYVLLVLLIVTRLFGELAVRLKQPALVGELVAGIFIGLLVTRFSGTFPILSGISDSEVFKAVTDLAIFFIMLLGGLEMRPRDVTQASGRAMPVAVGGILIPLAAGYGVGILFIPENPARVAQCLFIGVALAITAVPVTVKVLMDMGRLDSSVGQLVVAAAIFDDVISLVLLAILTAVAETGALPPLNELGWLGAKVFGFFVVSYVLGRYALPRVGPLLKRMKLEHVEISALLMWALALAVLAEVLGMHFVVGAFMAGLLFTRHSIDKKTHAELNEHLEGMTVGFFAPVFFASIGMHLDLGAVTAIPAMLGLILIVAFAGKLLGAGGAALAIGMPARESVAVGFAMNARGAVELIVADIALRAGLFSQPTPTPDTVRFLYSAIVIVAVVTTFLSPVILRRVLGSHQSG